MPRGCSTRRQRRPIDELHKAPGQGQEVLGVVGGIFEPPTPEPSFALDNLVVVDLKLLPSPGTRHGIRSIDRVRLVRPVMKVPPRGGGGVAPHDCSMKTEPIPI